MRRFAPQLFAQVFGISVLLLFASSSYAQRPQERVRNQQWSVERLKADTPPQPLGRDRQQIEADVRKDFRQLQLVNNNLMERMFGSAPAQKITNKEIRSSLGEIKKLAERLRNNFGIPKIKVEAEHDLALVPGLQQLDNAVSSFVENPLFQSRVFDAELASKAGKDLSDVLRLADLLRELTKQD